MFKAKQTATLTPTMVLLGVMPILTFALGTWQIQRLKWKVNLVDELQEKLHRQPIILPDFINTSTLSDFTYRKFIAEGKWDNPHTVLVGPRVRDNTKGFHVITPLVREGGSTILVDRGFVSDDFADLANWRKEEQTGPVLVQGMFRTSQPRNYFTPDNKPEKGEWFWIDVDAIAQYAGGDEAKVQPVFAEEIFEGHSGDAHLRLKEGTPIGRSPTVELRNMHATYAITWYSLSAFTTFMFVQLLRRRARSPAARLPR
ncbi:SURF1-domain-containing protein [Schizopora paradoxa]|uniref:SURF1-like protein n=1 Tax=Schizopora paradoxa TaxID=27342 RepID=A0A0H2S8T2_9AGAM|nr:SURF1-domain-containing protein [Schizopora paradoxa]